MSDHAFEAPPVEQRSSVKVSSNAKGEAQVEVKAVDGVAETELQRLRELAVGNYLAAMRHVRPAAPVAPGSAA